MAKFEVALTRYIFELDHLEGWAEVDTLCTGDYWRKELNEDPDKWIPMLKKFARSKNIHARRASLVMLCSPLGHQHNEALAKIAVDHILALREEKSVLITKAISWVMRKMTKHHRTHVVTLLDTHAHTLPPIAVRETRRKLETGKKSGVR